ncbi:MAG: lactonase family protein [Opitutaceae bacterium]
MPARLLALFSLLIYYPAATMAAEVVGPTDTLVYVGTYTGPKSQGIYLFRLKADGAAPALEPLGLAVEAPQPSFLAVDPSRNLLFALNESGSWNGQPTGSVASYAIDRQTGKLRKLSETSSAGAAPCHLVLDRSGHNLLVANYSAGNVALIRVDADGRLSAPQSIQQHRGQSVNPARQKGPHAHAVTLDPAERFLFGCDLGIDKVMAYRFDAEHGSLTPHEPAFAQLKPGAGPRHMVFRPDGRFAYVVNELDSTVTAFAYDAARGRLREVQNVSTLPAGFGGRSTTAEILVHPNGRLLYASNRGHDSLARFTIDPESGRLTATGHHPTGGKTPRHFGLDPTGTLLAMGNQDSDTIVLARVDPKTGALESSPHVASAPSPVCHVFLPPAGK